MIILRSKIELIHEKLQDNLNYSEAVTDYNIPAMQRVLKTHKAAFEAADAERQIKLALWHREEIELRK